MNDNFPFDSDAGTTWAGSWAEAGVPPAYNADFGPDFDLMAEGGPLGEPQHATDLAYHGVYCDPWTNSSSNSFSPNLYNSNLQQASWTTSAVGCQPFLDPKSIDPDASPRITALPPSKATQLRPQAAPFTPRQFVSQARHALADPALFQPVSTDEKPAPASNAPTQALAGIANLPRLVIPNTEAHVWDVVGGDTGRSLHWGVGMSKLSPSSPHRMALDSTHLSPVSPAQRGRDRSSSCSSSVADSTSSNITCSSQGCTRTFENMSEYRHHARYHQHGAQVCAVCSAKFHFPKDLVRHSRKHTQQRPYRCPLPGCEYAAKGFKRNDHLTRHLKQIHNLASATTSPAVSRPHTPS